MKKELWEKGMGDFTRRHTATIWTKPCNHCHCHLRNNKWKLLGLAPRIELLVQVHMCFTCSSFKSSSIVVTLIKTQFFYPLFTNLLYWACWVWIHLSFRNSAQTRPLQILLGQLLINYNRKILTPLSWEI